MLADYLSSGIKSVTVAKRLFWEGGDKKGNQLSGCPSLFIIDAQTRKQSCRGTISVVSPSKSYALIKPNTTQRIIPKTVKITP
jgi:hypothetical protein